MATVLNKPCRDTFTAIEADPQWTDSKHRIHSTNSLVGEGLLLIKDNKVTCTGTSNDPATLLKIYTSANLDVMFECISGGNKNWMLCVDPISHKLTTRERKQDYINFQDGEDDVVFQIEQIHGSNSSLLIKWKNKAKNEDKYIGFNEKGQPITLDKVSRSQSEAIFNLH